MAPPLTAIVLRRHKSCCQTLVVSSPPGVPELGARLLPVREGLESSPGFSRSGLKQLGVCCSSPEVLIKGRKSHFLFEVEEKAKTGQQKEQNVDGGPAGTLLGVCPCGCPALSSLSAVQGSGPQGRSGSKEEAETLKEAGGETESVLSGSGERLLDRWLMEVGPSHVSTGQTGESSLFKGQTASGGRRVSCCWR